LYCFIVLLFYCFIVLLFYCFIALLLYCFIVFLKTGYVDEIITLVEDAAALKSTFASQVQNVDLVIDYTWGPPAEAAINGIFSARANASQRLDWVQIGISLLLSLRCFFRCFGLFRRSLSSLSFVALFRRSLSSLSFVALFRRSLSSLSFVALVRRSRHSPAFVASRRIRRFGRFRRFRRFRCFSVTSLSSLIYGHF
jgi:hypothetical protein